MEKSTPEPKITLTTKEQMAGLDNALQQLRAERERTQSQLHRLDQAIAALEGAAGPKRARRRSPNRHARVVSSRRPPEPELWLHKSADGEDQGAEVKAPLEIAR